jgi:hypothetical protein
VDRCVCGTLLKEFPLHFMSCTYLNALRIVRHDKIGNYSCCTTL